MQGKFRFLIQHDLPTFLFSNFYFIKNHEKNFYLEKRGCENFLFIPTDNIQKDKALKTQRNEQPYTYKLSMYFYLLSI